MKIVVLGGGLSGIVCARELAKKGHIVTLIEKYSRLGGLASSFEKEGKLIPHTYHHFLPNEHLMLDYVKELGFEKELIWKKSAICFWFDKKRYKLNAPLDILFFKPFDFISKIRLGILGVITTLRSNWKSLQSVDADSWVRRIVGSKVTDTLFVPLSKVKFGSLSSVSAAWFGERLHEATSNDEKYAYLKTGLQPFIDSMGDVILENKGKIILNATVDKIESGKVRLTLNKKRKVLNADLVVSSLPPPVLSEISNLPSESKFLLESINYKPLISFIIGSKNNLSPNYWNVFIKPNYFFGGMFHHTILNPKGGIGGENLYYFFKYLDDSSLLKKQDEGLKKLFIKDIKSIWPKFDSNWTKLIKVPHSSPIYTMNYKNLPIKLTNWLYLTGVYRMYPNTRTMNSAARSGLITADKILSEISNKGNKDDLSK